MILAGQNSSFYYINSVDTTNFYLDFDEGSGQLSAQVTAGSYTMTTLADAIVSALNSTGTLTYTVTFDRNSRKYTISASGTFSLKITTGTHASQSVFTLIGFTGADTSFTTSHVSNNAVGTEYITQFPLQDYIDEEDFQTSVSVSINKAANGTVEVVKFGTEKFFQFSMTFITNIFQPSGYIRNNPTGLQDARLFLRFCITKNNLEFMPNTNDKSTFYTVLLEKTPDAKDGTGYKLKELYTKSLPGYFETGVLEFRVVE